jgi:NAD(P)H-hydrate epimerase
MLPRIKNKEIKALLKPRDPDSHKGDNDHVLIVGGSLDFFGAPILAGMGALRSGADLVSLFVPECNFECTRSSLPDFIVRKYPGEYLTERYVEPILEYAKKCDSMIIGPGISDNEKVLEACMAIVKNAKIPMVIDASAISVLKKLDKFPLAYNIVITPHMNEFRNLVDRDIVIDEADPKSIVFLRSIAMDLSLNILLKGPKDFCVSDDGDVMINETGNAGMTVGGSGDALCGVVGTFLAQKYEPFDAVRISAYLMGKAGDRAFSQYGNGLIASDLGDFIAKEMASIKGLSNGLGKAISKLRRN